MVIPCLLPAPVQAQDEVVVNVWIGNIVSGEGLNPEPETDTEGEGELDDWMLFNLSTNPGGRLDTNIGLPGTQTTINNFPQPLPPENPDTPLDPFIHVTLNNINDSVDLTWEWELPCETGNVAQGDTLTFDIFYGIEDDENIDLVVTGEGVTGWNLEGIMPCSSGTKTVTLSLEAPPPPSTPQGPPSLPIEREPFVPPEPPPPRPPLPEPVGTIAEVSFCPDDVTVTADPGQCFATNVYLGIPECIFEECVAAITNDAPFVFPVGETIVTWTTTDIRGNVVTCAQRVTVIESERYLEIDMLGEITRVRLVCPTCTVAQTSVASDPDDMHFLTIEKDTHVLCIEDDMTLSCPELIVMSISEETPPVTQGYILLSPIYEFIGYRDKESRYPICSHITFDLPITMLVSYDRDAVLSGTSAPFIAYFDIEIDDWVKLEHAKPGQVAEFGEGEVTGLTQRLSLFAVMAKPTDPYRVPVSLPGISSVDLRIVAAIVGGVLLVLVLILFRRRQRRKRLTTGS